MPLFERRQARFRLYALIVVEIYAFADELFGFIKGLKFMSVNNLDLWFDFLPTIIVENFIDFMAFWVIRWPARLFFTLLAAKTTLLLMCPICSVD